MVNMEERITEKCTVINNPKAFFLSDPSPPCHGAETSW